MFRFFVSICKQSGMYSLEITKKYRNSFVNSMGFILCHCSPLAVMVPLTMVPENGEVEMKVKLEFKIEVEMDAPILLSTCTGALCDPLIIVL